MSQSRYRNLSFVALLLAAACGDGDHTPSPSAPEFIEPSEDEIVNEEKAAEEEPAAPGLPCDVQAFLAKYCQGCHGAEAKNGTPLLTLENLRGVSKKDPDATVAKRSVMRMLDAVKPMPPASKTDRPTEAEFVMFVKWLEADMPGDGCQ